MAGMKDEVHSITDAPLKHSDEQRGRMVRYTVAMSIRIICFICAAVVGGVWQSWWAMVFVAAAVALPYVAVVDANVGGDRYMASRNAPDTPRQLSTGSETPDDPRQWWEEDAEEATSGQAPQHEVIAGEVLASNEAGTHASSQQHSTENSTQAGER